MKIRSTRFVNILVLPFMLFACSSAEAPQTEPPQLDNSHSTVVPESTALPNNSGIEGVQTYPDRVEYHKHVNVVPAAEGDLPPVFGEHFRAWQNCGIYDQPVELGSALHSMEHGAVWLTYRPDLSKDQIAELQNLVRGHGYVLMSPYTQQKSDVVLTAWGIQLVIDSIPDDRIAKFIAYYEEGSQNPEPGAPCSGAVGNPIQ